MKKFKKFFGMAVDYMRAGNLVNRWNLLDDGQKKDASELKRAFGWPIEICIQQVFLFGNSVEKENKLWGRI